MILRAALATLALSAAPAAAEPVRRPAGTGVVVQVTAARAYLDAGAEQGLASGQTLRLLRGGAVAATCEVETVAPRHATCKPDGAVRRGDHFHLAPPPAPAPRRTLPPLVPAEELDRRAAAVAAQPHATVEARTTAPAASAEAATRRSEAALSHAAWGSTGAPSWHQERLDATVRGAPAFAGLALDADLRAVRWTARPATFRQRPREQTSLFVYEAALSSRDSSRGLAGAFGRVVPLGVAGATTFDGAQLALVPASRSGEAGVFGGLVPDPITLAPTADRWTSGLYGALDLGGGARSSRSQARAAVTTSPELGTRFEGELRSVLLLGRTVNAEGMVRAGLGGKRQAPYGLDVLQLDLSGRPLPRVAVSALFRYAGLDVPDAPAPAIFPGHERRWDGSAGYEVGPALVSAAAGSGRDLSTGLERWYVGPEVAFPRAFGAHGSASLGYAEERGWIAGRTAWAQATLRAGPAVRLSGRLTWTADARAGAPDDQALGLLAAASADVGRWVVVSGSVLARVGARADLEALAGTAAGITAVAGLGSRF